MKFSLSKFIIVTFITITLFLNLSCSNNDNPIVQETTSIVTWEKTFGNTYSDDGYSVCETSDGGYIITGSQNIAEDGYSDVYLFKTDNNGNLEWERTFGDVKYDFGRSVCQTNDGGYIITGAKHIDEQNHHDVYLIKTDSNGKLVWEKTFGGLGTDTGRSVCQTNDGGYLIAGQTNINDGTGNTDVYLIKTDISGNVMWEKKYGGTDTDFGSYLYQTSDGGYIISGGTRSYGAGESDVYLIKIDNSGSLVWEKTIGGSQSEYSLSSCITSDGGLIITGGIIDTNSSRDVYLVKADNNGTLVWEKTFGGTGYDEGRSVCRTFDGGFLITGITNSIGGGSYDLYLIKTDNNGTLIWEKTYGGIHSDSGRSVKQTSDGGYIITGNTRKAGMSDVYLIKTDKDGNVLSE